MEHEETVTHEMLHAEMRMMRDARDRDRTILLWFIALVVGAIGSVWAYLFTQSTRQEDQRVALTTALTEVANQKQQFASMAQNMEARRTEVTATMTAMTATLTGLTAYVRDSNERLVEKLHEHEREGHR